MKKKLLAILLCVALIASLSVGLAACNKDEGAQKMSNAETLGTAIAMAANTVAGGQATAAESEDDAEAGLNLNITASGTASVIVNGAISGLEPALEAIIQASVGSVQCFVNENGVKVETLAKDDAEFIKDKDYTLKVSVTYANEEEENVTDVYYLAVDTDGADIEGTKSFSFSIGVYAKDADDELYAIIENGISGTATYNEEIEGLKFTFSADIAGLAQASINAYATKEGTIGIEVKAGVVGIDASIKIELGKLADDKYGADITVFAGAKDLGISATVNISVVAEKVDTTHQFAINGSVVIMIDSKIGDNDYRVTADVSGSATYDEVEGEFVVSLSGDASVVPVAKEETK